jgi:hypothetical protein
LVQGGGFYADVVGRVEEVFGHWHGD